VVKGLAPSGIREKTKRKLRMDISTFNNYSLWD